MLTVINNFDFVFSENGLVAHKEGKLFKTQVLSSLFSPHRLLLLLFLLFLLFSGFAHVFCRASKSSWERRR